MLRLSFIVSVVIFCSLSEVAAQRFTPKYSTVISPSKGRKLLEQCSRVVPNDVSGFTTLSKEEIGILEKNFGKLLSVKPFDFHNSNTKIQALKHYGYQYLGMFISGKKYIYINAFPVKRRSRNWKAEPLVVCDGGNFFWGALFSLEDLSFTALSVNIDV